MSYKLDEFNPYGASAMDANLDLQITAVTPKSEEISPAVGSQVKKALLAVESNNPPQNPFALILIASGKKPLPKPKPLLSLINNPQIK